MNDRLKYSSRQKSFRSEQSIKKFWGTEVTEVNCNNMWPVIPSKNLKKSSQRKEEVIWGEKW